MRHELTITTERIDDIRAAAGSDEARGPAGIAGSQSAAAWLSQQDLSWGWIATIWLAHILSQGDHRKVTVHEWVRQAQTTLAAVTGLSIREEDFTDDRLGLLLRRLSKLETWHAIEQDLGQNIVRVYRLPTQTVRLDATTVSGYHTGTQGESAPVWAEQGRPDVAPVESHGGDAGPVGLAAGDRRGVGRAGG